MRTKHLLMAIATLLVAGCSQNEITEVRTVGNPAVGFDVYTGVATRGTDVSTTTMQGTCDETHYGGFGIMGYYTGSKNWDEAKGTVTPSFMFNQKVTQMQMNGLIPRQSIGRTTRQTKCLSLPMLLMRAMYPEAV